MAPLIEHDIRVSQTRLMVLSCREGILFKSKHLHQLARIMHQHNTAFTLDVNFHEMGDAKSSTSDRIEFCVFSDSSDQDTGEENAAACDLGHFPAVVSWPTDRADDSETSDEDVASMQLQTEEEDSCCGTSSGGKSMDHRKGSSDEGDLEDEDDIRRISYEPSSSKSNVKKASFVIEECTKDGYPHHRTNAPEDGGRGRDGALLADQASCVPPQARCQKVQPPPFASCLLCLCRLATCDAGEHICKC